MKKRGIINTIVLIVVALIILGYYKIDIRDIIQSPLAESNLNYARNVTVWGIDQAWKFIEQGVQTLLNK
jgi:hypothetical protein